MRHPLYLVALTGLWLFLCLMIGRIAASWFHRRPAIWILLAIVLSPVVAFILLLVVGDLQRIETLREREERIRQRHPERTDARDAALNALTCPHCGAEVNPVTGDGVHSSELEPWLLICDRCGKMIEPEA